MVCGHDCGCGVVVVVVVSQLVTVIVVVVVILERGGFRDSLVHTAVRAPLLLCFLCLECGEKPLPPVAVVALVPPRTDK